MLVGREVKAQGCVLYRNSCRSEEVRGRAASPYCFSLCQAMLGWSCFARPGRKNRGN